MKEKDLKQGNWENKRLWKLKTTNPYSCISSKLIRVGCLHYRLRKLRVLLLSRHSHFFVCSLVDWTCSFVDCTVQERQQLNFSFGKIILQLWSLIRVGKASTEKSFNIRIWPPVVEGFENLRISFLLWLNFLWRYRWMRIVFRYTPNRSVSFYLLVNTRNNRRYYFFFVVLLNLTVIVHAFIVLFEITISNKINLIFCHKSTRWNKHSSWISLYHIMF